MKKDHQELEEIVSHLDQEVAEVGKNTEHFTKKDEELSSLGEVGNQSENHNINEVIIHTAPVYKQIQNLYKEKNASEDTIFYLGEAIRQGVIDLGIFLSHVCLLSREQFHLSTLMQRARRSQSQ